MASKKQKINFKVCLTTGIDFPKKLKRKMHPKGCIFFYDMKGLNI
tara:strand:- start:784 stop:918 length:135 start_codon:yes stop_codon:yes gene_type:complete